MYKRQLPEAGGIVWGNPAGKTVTVFSDFRCGYCRALSSELEAMNVRVIERPISVLGSRDLANQVFCARDRRKAVKSAYAGAPIIERRPVTSARHVSHWRSCRSTASYSRRSARVRAVICTYAHPASSISRRRAASRWNWRGSPW